MRMQACVSGCAPEGHRQCGSRPDECAYDGRSVCGSGWGCAPPGHTAHSAPNRPQQSLRESGAVCAPAGHRVDAPPNRSVRGTHANCAPQGHSACGRRGVLCRAAALRGQHPSRVVPRRSTARCCHREWRTPRTPQEHVPSGWTVRGVPRRGTMRVHTAQSRPRN